jgi:hypothetical protein
LTACRDDPEAAILAAQAANHLIERLLGVTKTSHDVTRVGAKAERAQILLETLDRNFEPGEVRLIRG